MGKVPSVDYSIIHIDGEMSSLYLRPKDHIHYGLEGCQGVCHTKEHYKWLEEPFCGEECSFPLVSFYLNVVVSPVNVKFSEEGASC